MRSIGIPEIMAMFGPLIMGVVILIGVLWGLYGMRNERYCAACRKPIGKANFCPRCGQRPGVA
jgi:hypothetical protein